MRLQKQVEFGLNYSVPMQRNQIELGTMVQDGIDVDRMPVYLDKEILDKHIFIAGVTGNGKTTTCQKILLQSGLPFLVIEPAKTESRYFSAPGEAAASSRALCGSLDGCAPGRYGWRQ